MIHIMKLQEAYFNYIKNGTKEYEIRLNDEKRRNIKIGDYIEFQKEPLKEEKFIVKVEDLLYYENFSKLFDNINIISLADKSIKREELENDLNKFYSIEEQESYGVVAIKLNKDIIINQKNINKISSNNKIFNILKEKYNNFDTWLNKLKEKNINIYCTEKDNELSSILILKINETDSEQFQEEGNILKIRTILVEDKNKGIGKMYLDLVDEIAKENYIDYIYLTVKIDNNELINYIKNNNYKLYNKYKDEYVYYKELK